MTGDPRFVVLTPIELEQLVERAAERGARRALAAAATGAASEWVDAATAAGMLGCDREYLRRLEDLTRHGLPRSPRYRRSEVEACIERRRRGEPAANEPPRRDGA